MQPVMERNTDTNYAVFLKVADEFFRRCDLAATFHFVSCFSEVPDDLGQWRGYGGGECGYAIGFQFQGLQQALKSRPNSQLLPMQYDADRSHRLVDDTLRMMKHYFLDGISAKGITDGVERWAREFFDVFAVRHLDIFSSTIKHHVFADEKELRILARLQQGDRANLEFRQKRTLLARHLPLKLTSVDGVQKLPLTRICVGPVPAQRVSKVSVGDLLLKHGYTDVPVDLSTVPYRVP
jgi:hypothetical protein